MSPILGIWASSFAQPTGDYQAIMTATVDSGGASSITFSSIPSTFKHLQIRGIAKNSQASDLRVQYNSDTATNYAWHYLLGNGSSAVAGAATTTSSMVISTLGATANVFNGIVADIHDYTNTSKNKTIRTLSGNDFNGSGSVFFISGLWISTAAISNIKLFPDAGTFSQYTSFTLYGIKGA